MSKEKKPKLYVVLEYSSCEDLERYVNNKMAMGYIPMGGVATSEIGYVQAMIYKRS